MEAGSWYLHVMPPNELWSSVKPGWLSPPGGSGSGFATAGIVVVRAKSPPPPDVLVRYSDWVVVGAGLTVIVIVAVAQSAVGSQTVYVPTSVPVNNGAGM